jgi:probable addiction module antidote protein
MVIRKNNSDIEILRDPRIAEAYLQKALDIHRTKGDIEVFLQALHNLAKCQGGMSSLSRKTGINRQNLYRNFADTGNPKFKSLSTILNALGFTLAIQPIHNDADITRNIDSTIERIVANTNSDLEEEAA